MLVNFKLCYKKMFYKAAKKFSNEFQKALKKEKISLQEE